MKTFKKGLLSVTCILTLCTNVQSQVFTVDGNSAWNWDVADRHDTNGTFINDNGMVRTLKAPVIGSVNERNTVRNNFTSAGVPWNEVLATDYFLGNNSAFGLQIANMDAVRNTQLNWQVGLLQVLVLGIVQLIQSVIFGGLYS